MSDILSNNIDTNKNKKIETKELQSALDGGLFDDEDFLQELGKELGVDDDMEWIDSFFESIAQLRQDSIYKDRVNIWLEKNPDTLMQVERLGSYETIDIPSNLSKILDELGLDDEAQQDYYKSYLDSTTTDANTDKLVATIGNKLKDMNILASEKLGLNIEMDVLYQTMFPILMMNGQKGDALALVGQEYDNRFFSKECEKAISRMVETQQRMVTHAKKIESTQSSIDKLLKHKIKPLLEKTPGLWRQALNHVSDPKKIATVMIGLPVGLWVAGKKQDKDMTKIDKELLPLLEQVNNLYETLESQKAEGENYQKNIIEHKKILYENQYKILKNNFADKKILSNFLLQVRLDMGKECLSPAMKNDFDTSLLSKYEQQCLNGNYTQMTQELLTTGNNKKEDILQIYTDFESGILCEHDITALKIKGKEKLVGYDCIAVPDNYFFYKDCIPAIKKNKDGSIDYKIIQKLDASQGGTHALYAAGGSEYIVNNNLSAHISSEDQKIYHEKQQGVQLLLNNNTSFISLGKKAATLHETIGKVQGLHTLTMYKDKKDKTQTHNKTEGFASYMNKEAGNIDIPELRKTLKHIGGDMKSITGSINSAKLELQLLQKNKNKEKLFGRYATEIEKELEEKIDGLTQVYNGLVQGSKFLTYMEQVMTNPAKYGVDDLEHWFRTEGVIYLAAIGTAVAAIVSFGALAPAALAGNLALISAIGAVGGIAGQELGHLASQKMGKSRYGEQYDNKSMLGQYVMGDQFYNPQTGDYEEIPGGKVLEKYGKDFVRNFVTTFALMGMGQIVGRTLSRIATQHATSAGVMGNISKLINKIPKMKAQSVNMAEKGGFQTFLKKFGKEFAQELGEETGENIAQKMNNGLGFIAQVYFCLTPGKVNLNLGSIAGQELGIVQHHAKSYANEGDSLVMNAFTYTADQQESVLTSLKASKKDYEIVQQGSIITCTKQTTTKKGTYKHVMVFEANSEPHLQREITQHYEKELELYGATVEDGILTIGALQPEGKASFETFLKRKGYIVLAGENGKYRVRRGNHSFEFSVVEKSDGKVSFEKKSVLDGEEGVQRVEIEKGIDHVNQPKEIFILEKSKLEQYKELEKIYSQQEIGLLKDELSMRENVNLNDIFTVILANPIFLTHRGGFGELVNLLNDNDWNTKKIVQNYEEIASKEYYSSTVEISSQLGVNIAHNYKHPDGYTHENLEFKINFLSEDSQKKLWADYKNLNPELSTIEGPSFTALASKFHPDDIIFGENVLFSCYREGDYSHQEAHNLFLDELKDKGIIDKDINVGIIFSPKTIQRIKDGLGKKLLGSKAEQFQNKVFSDVINNYELQAIMSQEIKDGNLVLDEDGNVSKILIEINGEKKLSILFQKMLDDGFSKEQALKTWLQVRTENFKNWFGDWQTNPEGASKMVDENGEPQVVYHGGVDKFNAFLTPEQLEEKGLITKRVTDGISTTSSKDVAQSYIDHYHKKHNKPNPTLYPLFINLKKTVELDHITHYMELFDYVSYRDFYKQKGYDVGTYEKYQKLRYELQNAEFDTQGNAKVFNQTIGFLEREKLALSPNEINPISREEKLKIIKSFTDGAIFKEHADGTHGGFDEKGQPIAYDQQLILDPRNLKSAIDNDGSFDDRSSNIYGEKTTLESKNQYNFSEEIQTENSLNSDKLIDNGKINQEAKQHVEKFLHDNKVLKDGEVLSNEQVKKIYEVHNMKRKSGETDDIKLNQRKGFVLRKLFNKEQIRVLMEGKVCGILNSIKYSQSIKLIDLQNQYQNEKSSIKKSQISEEYAKILLEYGTGKNQGVENLLKVVEDYGENPAVKIMGRELSKFLIDQDKYCLTAILTEQKKKDYKGEYLGGYDRNPLYKNSNPVLYLNSDFSFSKDHPVDRTIVHESVHVLTFWGINGGLTAKNTKKHGIEDKRAEFEMKFTDQLTDLYKYVFGEVDIDENKKVSTSVGGVLSHIATTDQKLRYAGSYDFEFLAEALSDIELQERLLKIPPTGNIKVSNYAKVIMKQMGYSENNSILHEIYSMTFDFLKERKITYDNANHYTNFDFARARSDPHYKKHSYFH